MKSKKKTDQLDIELTKSWPLGTLKEVMVKREGHIVYDKIELTKAQAEQLYYALEDILEIKREVIS